MARYEDFDRDEWAASSASASPANQSAGDVPAAELTDVYVPLAELVRERAAGAEPFVVAITGSVAVGKSASAEALAAVLAPGPPARSVDVVGTDGFLFPNRVLAARGLSERKGFPETFDHEAMVRFLTAVRSGAAEVHAPVYSHTTYDVVEGGAQVVRRPAVLILEGLPFPDDHVDLSIFLDAAERRHRALVRRRGSSRCATRRRRTTRRSSGTSTASRSDDAVAFARQVWDAINRVNLHEHILPARDGCDVILEKGPDHAVRRVRLRVP